MSHEKPRVEYYDSSVDDVFRTSVVEHLFVPARERLEAHDQLFNSEGSYLATSASMQLGENQRAVYDFYASKHSSHILVHAHRFVLIDVSPEAAQLIADALPTSDLEPEVAVDYVCNPSKLLDQAKVEQSTTYTFEIDTAINDVTVSIEMGIYVDDAEVDAVPVEDRSDIDIDFERETIFEIDTLGELLHGLYRMRLIDQNEIDQFLRTVGLLKLDDL